MSYHFSPSLNLLEGALNNIADADMFPGMLREAIESKAFFKVLG
jgi:hypothetical protein